MTQSLSNILLAVALLGAVGCGEKEVKSALEREADRNMPPKAELTEPLYWPDDKVRNRNEQELLSIVDVVWCRSRRYPNGGYNAYRVDGWWYRCVSAKDAESQFGEWDTHDVYIPERDIMFVETGIPIESRTAVEAKGGE